MSATGPVQPLERGHAPPSTPRAELLWALGAAAVLATLFFISPLLQGFFHWADNAHYFLANKVLLGQRLAAGDFPLWTPLIGIGLPLAADPQAGAFYPTSALYALLHPLAAQSIDLLLHPTLSCFFTFAYARKVGLSRPAAAFAAVCYGLSGYAGVHFNRQGVVNALPWLPAALLALEQHRRGGSALPVVLAGVALAMPVIAGHPQTALYAWLAVGLHTLAVAIIERRPRQLAWAAVSYLVGAGIAALQTLPTLALLPHLTRARMTESQQAVGTLRPDMLYELVSPGDGAVAFVGLLPVVLTLLAVVHMRRLTPPVRAWILVAAVGLLLMLGRFTPLGQLLAHLPGFDVLRYPARHVLYVALAAGVLAGAAIDLLTESASEVGRTTLRWLRRRWQLLAFCLLIGLALLKLLGGLPSPTPDDPDPLQTLGPAKYTKARKIFREARARSYPLELAIFALGLAALYGVFRKPRLAWALAPLLLVDSWTTSQHVTTAEFPRRSFFSNPLLEELRRRGGRGARLVLQPRWMKAAELTAGAPLYPNAASIFGLDSVLVYSAVQPADYIRALGIDHLGMIDDFTPGAKADVLSLIGVRYLVLDPIELAAARQLMTAPTPGPVQRVARLSWRSPPPLAKRTTTTPDGLLLAGAADLPAELRRPLSLRPHRTYTLSLRGRYLGRDPTLPVEPLFIEILAGGDVLARRWVAPTAKAEKVRTYRWVVASGAAPATGWLRVSSCSRYLVEWAEVHLRPPPRTQEAGGGPLVSEALATHGPWTLVRNRAALPRVRLVRRAVPASSAADAARQLALLGDYERAAPIEGIRTPVTFGGGSAKILEDRGDELLISSTSEGPGQLIISDLYLPGWRAWVDERPAPIRRAYGFMRAIPVPAGKSIVALRYDCPGLDAGIASVCATAAFCLLLLLWDWRRRRRTA